MVVLKELWDFLEQFLLLDSAGGLERTDFEPFLHQFLLWNSVEVLKELILTVDSL